MKIDSFLVWVNANKSRFSDMEKNVIVATLNSAIEETQKHIDLTREGARDLYSVNISSIWEQAAQTIADSTTDVKMKNLADKLDYKAIYWLNPPEFESEIFISKGLTLNQLREKVNEINS